MDWRTERDGALLALERQKEVAARTEAAQALLALGEADPAGRAPELSVALTRLLADGQAEVRRAGVALGAVLLPADEAQALLVSRLGDKAVLVRMEAAGRIADLARPDARGVLASALQDPALEVRFEAARGMAVLHHPAGLDVLVEALVSEALRFRALGALAELGDTRALPAVSKLFHRWLLPAFEKTQAAGALAKLGEAEGADYLLARTRKRWTPDRAMAVEMLGEVKAAGALERLVELVSQKDESARGAAARGLGRLGDARALEPLSAMLAEPGLPEDLKLDAAQGLLHLGLPEARARVLAAAPGFTTAEARAELDELLEDFP